MLSVTMRNVVGLVKSASSTAFSDKEALSGLDISTTTLQIVYSLEKEYYNWELNNTCLKGTFTHFLIHLLQYSTMQICLTGFELSAYQRLQNAKRLI